MIPVILSGGTGSRLWPMSRSLYPKQFLRLASNLTMLQDTLTRLDDMPDLAAPMVVCNEEHRFMVAEQLRAIDRVPSDILLEPEGRNTAPAIALAALKALDNPEHDDPVLLVLPADHIIQDVSAFHRAIAAASIQADRDKLVTFGIVPVRPETGYGYIKAGEALEGEHPTRPVARFVEKPDQQTAENYLASGDYYWNSGMFMFKAGRYVVELARHNPTMLEACRTALERAQTDLDFTRIHRKAFAACPANSIDYAVMEPLCSNAEGSLCNIAEGSSAAVVVVPMAAGWSDVGAWSALWDASDKDEQGNVFNGDVIAHESKNCFAETNGKLMALVGVEDAIVIQTDDAVMVAHKDRVQDVKAIVSQLKEEGRSEALVHRKVYRPWGYYDSIDSGDRFQVKRIVVNPGQKLSLQMHHHRAEHWIVVKGTAKVTNGDREMLVSENESTYIPLGSKHRLENPGTIPLELIEVQSGGYLGEDDIVRFEDTYGRGEKGAVKGGSDPIANAET